MYSIVFPGAPATIFPPVTCAAEAPRRCDATNPRTLKSVAPVFPEKPRTRPQFASAPELWYGAPTRKSL